ncbi:MAG: hypothetical protein CMJ49_03880 [Planctomycetaceae bacterium]|nr:hypothetical protein [Planctomycetaceae bacterium]
MPIELYSGKHLFIDALKTEYDAYDEQILPRLHTGGPVTIDSILWDGRIIDPDADDPDTLALRQLNDKIAADRRVDSVMLALSDGLTIVRKR